MYAIFYFSNSSICLNKYQLIAIAAVDALTGIAAGFLLGRMF